MRRISYFIVTLILGILIHFLLNHYLSYAGVGPEFILLLVVGHGFFMGPFMGETMGFVWGLILDSIGVSFFGLQSLLFAIAGFGAGVLRKRIASERPATQLVIAVVTTTYYYFGSLLIRNFLAEGGFSPVWYVYILGLIVNVLLVTGTFWALEWWLSFWKMKKEQI